MPTLQEPSSSEHEGAEKAEEEKKNETIILESLKSAWSKFSDQRLSSENANESDRIILNKEVRLVEETTVEITITNQLEKDILGRFETDLIQFLREQLKNDFIKINTQLKQIEESKKLYTSKDKFDHMVSQNNNLLLLQEKLGLDHDV